MVDCSHANSSKQHERQLDVARDIGGSWAAAAQHLRRDGGKPPPRRRAEVHARQGRRRAAYGQSITDACIGWDDSRAMLQVLSDAVRRGARGGTSC
jgi:3-deoxy-7-phosphoheptulonate synthase